MRAQLTKFRPQVIDQTKGLVNQYLNTDSSSSSSASSGNPSGDAAPRAIPDAAESLGVTSGAERLSTDTGDATFAGDIERQSGDSGLSPAYAAYNASGRDATGSFDGGANDPPNLGAGEMPGRST
ncbi:hypothetical protein RTG_02773 [Rhodotorula toruloides ATCC 204091]|uniref:Uncharacterized protein n=1 Tax=Rhodotorula toruloides TaxID=5286 RepID=A0A0K3CB72_RHOTO|nr:hypothetical protein RTG_02773 [Rhodotorula toruloides ATCC 204091]